jgi:hypothetical protein
MSRDGSNLKLHGIPRDQIITGIGDGVGPLLQIAVALKKRIVQEENGKCLQQHAGRGGGRGAGHGNH